MEFTLPKQSYVHKVVPKSKFFSRAKVNTKLKQEFVDLVQRITWEHKLAVDTLGIQKTEAVEEIQIFKLELKKRSVPKNVLKVIDKTIPYPILFTLRYGNQTAYAISLKVAGDERYYISKWGTDVAFRFTGRNLETVYQGLVSALMEQPVSTEAGFATMVETDKKRVVLEREIAALKSKIRNEKQFSKKVELNHQLQAKKSNLESLIPKTV